MLQFGISLAEQLLEHLVVSIAVLTVSLFLVSQSDTATNCTADRRSQKFYGWAHWHTIQRCIQISDVSS